MENQPDVQNVRTALPADAPIAEQVAALERVIRSNPNATAILERAAQLGLPSWYLGAGAVAQTVWNNLHGFDPTDGIKDYDLIYFDSEDLSSESEQEAQNRARHLFADLHVVLDVKNEARVHLWYPQRFDRTIQPYRSAEHAVSTWPSTASSIAVRYEPDMFVVCAPFGLKDLFSLVVRPNKAIVSQSAYEEKAVRWAARWSRLTFIPW
ncbi:MAG TPA: nucleotidyltransferase family protein [Dehalococcoidia bacterium]|nr:nucleotidyltransferase family protein [Dehalococcoidia bacterium]